MSGKRKSLRPSVRFEVFKRDRFTCQYCGRTPPDVVLVVDHITAVANGGTDDEENLVSSCELCNSGKWARELSQVPAPLLEGLEEKQERLAQMEAYNDFLMEQREYLTNVAREIGSYWYGPKGYTFSDSRLNTVRNFLKILPQAFILEAVDIARSKIGTNYRDEDRCFRYFCGVCYRMIERRNQ